MYTSKNLLFTVVGENVIIVKVGKRPHRILFHGTLSLDDYKRLINHNLIWFKFEVTHIKPDGNVLRVEVKESSI